jgi:apolipoprotein N-acyltransferase
VLSSILEPLPPWVKARVLNRGQWLLAAIGGWMWAASFPRMDWGGLAWVAPGLVLLGVLAPAGNHGWRGGYAAGLVYALVSLSWLLHIPFPAGAIAGWVALSLYVACYPALWVWLCGVTLHGLTAGSTAEATENEGGCWGRAMERLLGGVWWRRALWCWSGAVYWVALEMTQARLFSGFPWNPLGVSQHGMLPLIQVAAWTGVYGVSFLVVWVSIALGLAALRVARQPGWVGVWVGDLWIPLVLTLAIAVAGLGRVTRAPEADRTLEVALVQPSIPQELIWDHGEDDARFERVMALSREALLTEPDLLVWPEAAMPPLTESMVKALIGLVAGHGVWMVFGSDEVEWLGSGPVEERAYAVYNSAFLLGSDGAFEAGYRKQRLVIFGEYIPMERWFPFLKVLTPIEGSFTPGPGPVWFELREPRARMSVLICFEDVFPHLARRHVRDDTEFLLNLTNNGWFGRSAAQWQHTMNAVFRAVENGVVLVRCTNNGITCWIDARGRVRDVLVSEDGGVYGPGYLRATIPLRAAGAEATLYRRYGDWFGWGCVVFALWMLGWSWRSGRQTSLR